MQLYEGVNLDHAYPISIGEYDHEEYRDLHFEIEDGTDYVIYLTIDEIYAPGPGGEDSISEVEGKLVMSVSFGVYGGTLGDIDYHRRDVGTRTMYRILATVMKAVVEEAERSQISAIVFAADKEEKQISRRRAYRVIAEQAAKFFDWRYMISEYGVIAETYYVFTPDLTEEDIIALLVQNEDLSANTVDDAISQAFEILDTVEIHQPLHEGIGKMYWKNGGPTRTQNDITSFDDIKSGKAGAELLKGFDLSKREVHYLGPVLGDELVTRIAEKGMGRFMEDSKRFFESKDYAALLQKMKAEKDPDELSDFFNSLEEDVGMSANFQLHAPEHMLPGSPITLRTGKAGEVGLRKAKRGAVEDDSWDGAYNKTVSRSFLREEVFQVTKNQLPQQAASMKPRLLSKNVVMIVTDPDTKGNPVDVQPGPPAGFIAYGRGGVLKGQLWIDGGAGGSPDGHKSGTTMGFYWGVTREPQRGGQRVLVLRGRNGATPQQYETFFRNNLDLILKDTVGKIPPAR